jgi:hypothetical protein
MNCLKCGGRMEKPFVGAAGSKHELGLHGLWEHRDGVYPEGLRDVW